MAVCEWLARIVRVIRGGAGGGGARKSERKKEDWAEGRERTFPLPSAPFLFTLFFLLPPPPLPSPP